MRYEIEGKLLSDIGDAIREKTGKSELILPGDMPGEIDGISGGEVPLLTIAEWNALTTEQKQSYGYIGIANKGSGLNRGILYYGADYKDIGAYIPNSNVNNILCEAYGDNYIPDEAIWGVTNTNQPLNFYGGNPVASVEGDTTVLTFSTSQAAWMDLKAINTSCTLYLVVKGISQGYFYYIIGNVYQMNDGNGPSFAVNGGKIFGTQYGSNYDTGLSFFDWHVLTLKVDNTTKKVTYYYDGTKGTSTHNYTNSGEYVSINAGAINSTTNWQRFCSTRIAYFAAVSEAESDETILANQSALMEHFSDLY